MAEFIEGEAALQSFRQAVAKVVSVSHEEIQRRIKAEQERAALKPNRPGPKRKAKPAASPVAGA